MEQSMGNETEISTYRLVLGRQGSRQGDITPMGVTWKGKREMKWTPALCKGSTGGGECGGLNNDQYHVEVFLRHPMPCLHKQCRATMLVTIQAPIVMLLPRFSKFETLNPKSPNAKPVTPKPKKTQILKTPKAREPSTL